MDKAYNIPLDMDEPAEFYLLNYPPTPPDNQYPLDSEANQYSLDADDDARRYQALWQAAQALWKAACKTPRLFDTYGVRTRSEPRQSLLLPIALCDVNFKHERNFFPDRLGFSMLQPGLEPIVFVAPFLNPPDKNDTHVLIVSSNLKNAIEQFEPDRHTFFSLELHFSNGVEHGYHYLFTKNQIFGTVEHTKEHAGLMGDYWDINSYPGRHLRARRNAVVGLHWILGPGGFIVSAELMMLLQRLIIPTDPGATIFYPIKLVDDKMAQAYLDFPKLRSRM
jgi:hypothetical protein